MLLEMFHDRVKRLIPLKIMGKQLFPIISGGEVERAAFGSMASTRCFAASSVIEAKVFDAPATDASSCPFRYVRLVYRTSSWCTTFISSVVCERVRSVHFYEPR